MAGYTQEADPDTMARAIGKEVPVSPKDTREVCRMLRHKRVNDAIKILEEIIDLQRPVPFKRYNTGVPHKAGIAAGRFPKKSAQAVLDVLESAKHNAEYKGLDADNMRIKVIAPSLGRVIAGYMPRAYGRSTQWNQQTVNIEVILEEVE
jgi:large subunit ribosomal protein L22